MPTHEKGEKMYVINGDDSTLYIFGHIKDLSEILYKYDFIFEDLHLLYKRFQDPNKIKEIIQEYAKDKLEYEHHYGKWCPCNKYEEEYEEYSMKLIIGGKAKKGWFKFTQIYIPEIEILYKICELGFTKAEIIEVNNFYWSKDKEREYVIQLDNTFYYDINNKKKPLFLIKDEIKFKTRDEAENILKTIHLIKNGQIS